MMLRVLLGAALLTASATPAMAQQGMARTAHAAIVAGDFATAERTLVAERQIFPANAEVMVNLAAVYAATGRPAQAASLYRDVLDRDAVMLDRGDATAVSSHQLAKLGLARVSAVQTASR